MGVSFNKASLYMNQKKRRGVFFYAGKTDALSFGDFNRKTITIDKAVKQGRGSAYNSTALQQISGSQFKTSRTVTACPGGEDCGCKETNIDLKKKQRRKILRCFF